MGFDVKDSGQRQEFASGMVRDTQDGKVDYTLIADGPMLDRWAAHLTKGAGKYAPRNWMLASGEAEYERFRQSAFRHFLQWMRGETDEDHAAAVMFNLNGAEYVKAQFVASEDVIVEYQEPGTAQRFVDVEHGHGYGVTLDDSAKMGPPRSAKFGSHPQS